MIKNKLLIGLIFIMALLLFVMPSIQIGLLPSWINIPVFQILMVGGIILLIIILLQHS